ncbi:high-affinity iron transporter [Pseudochelatococcus lubricantis]|uniref:High-affinity iron transporter n=1 Tax=Pseudochelatococcus lubricantis TaxID=1538102 RepID=A0ABX0V4I0_9HYPH|nr:iron uptake transporter permease EfeU [Pseudochelatococcus lubricantis]NIJ58989.1 high-affinity iron transporter [Pseudochelatococcus lubricantis]
MLAPFLIMLREGLEAALVVGIIAGYLKQTGRAAWLPAVWVGILLALALTLFAGAALQALSSGFPQKAQELFEAIIGLVAVVVLTSMVFWMRKVARSIRHELHDHIDAAFTGGRNATLALIGMAFFAVAREGLESLFFLLAIFQQSEGLAVPLGALLGLLAAAALGYGIYWGGVRLNLRLFFRWTGIFILFVAAGILAGALRALHEAGVWNRLQATAFDASHWLPLDSVAGSVLAGLFGYHETPAVGEVIAYIAFLALTLPWFLWTPAPPAPSAVSGSPG